MPSDQPPAIRAYAHLVLVGIIVFLVLLWVYSLSIPHLTEFGEVYFVRYVLLVPLGLIGALVLFGLMRSSSTIHYKKQNLTIKIGGPAALFALIVFGGIKLVPTTPSTFDITVRPQSADAPIISSGSIVIDLDSDRRSQRISPDGEADFKQIPWRFRGARVKAMPQIDGYEETPQSVVLSGSVITLSLVKLPPAVTVFRGSIVLPKGKARNVKILIEGQGGEYEGSPDDSGRFAIKVGGMSGDRVRVRILVNGNPAYDDFQTLPGPVTLVLDAGIRSPNKSAGPSP